MPASGEMNNTIYKIQVVSQKIFSKSNQNNLYTCHSLQRLFSKSKKVQIKKCEEKGKKRFYFFICNTAKKFH